MLWSQQLGRNLGHKVSQATDSTSTADIFDLIENDIPQVLSIYMYINTLSTILLLVNNTVIVKMGSGSQKYFAVLRGPWCVSTAHRSILWCVDCYT